VRPSQPASWLRLTPKARATAAADKLPLATRKSSVAFTTSCTLSSGLGRGGLILSLASINLSFAARSGPLHTMETSTRSGLGNSCKPWLISSNYLRFFQPNELSIPNAPRPAVSFRCESSTHCARRPCVDNENQVVDINTPMAYCVGVVFVETRVFNRRVQQYMDDDEYGEMQACLL